MKKIRSNLSSVRVLFLLAVAIALVWGFWPDGSPAAAQQVPPPRIGTIDTAAVLLKSNFGSAAAKKLEKLQETKQGELTAMANEIKDLRAAIDSGKGPANGAALIDAKMTAMTRAQQDAQKVLEKAKDAMLSELEAKSMPVINAVAKELGYTMVFRKFESGLIYAHESTDITETVITRLNALN